MRKSLLTVLLLTGLLPLCLQQQPHTPREFRLVWPEVRRSGRGGCFRAPAAPPSWLPCVPLSPGRVITHAVPWSISPCALTAGKKGHGAARACVGC